MKLVTPELAAALPRIRATADLPAEQIKVPLKVFNPGGAGTWFVTEFDPETGEAFGFVTGLGHDELGYFDLGELQEFRGRFGLALERDLYWDGNATLAQVMKGERR